MWCRRSALALNGMVGSPSIEGSPPSQSTSPLIKSAAMLGAQDAETQSSRATQHTMPPVSRRHFVNVLLLQPARSRDLCNKVAALCPTSYPTWPTALGVWHAHPALCSDFSD